MARYFPSDEKRAKYKTKISRQPSKILPTCTKRHLSCKSETNIHPLRLRIGYCEPMTAFPQLRQHVTIMQVQVVLAPSSIGRLGTSPPLCAGGPRQRGRISCLVLLQSPAITNLPKSGTTPVLDAKISSQRQLSEEWDIFLRFYLTKVATGDAGRVT